MDTTNGAPVLRTATPRMAWIDNIRWTMIAMVVLVHACVTYSGLGSWYYKEPHTLDMGSLLVFAFYEIFSQAFFMGLLFFVAATFMPSSYDRKGFVRFVGERAFRLGLPTLAFMLVLDPLTNLVRDLGTGKVGPWPSRLEGYVPYVLGGHFLNASGPLWFAFALLAFSIAYALVRLATGLVRGTGAPAAREAMPLTPRALHATAVLIMLTIAVGSFLVRLAQPIGTDWHNMQLCYFSEYVVLFIVGLWAGRRGFLRALPREAGMMWLKLAFIVGVPAWFLLLGLGGALTGHSQALLGGMHWQAGGFAAWEAFFAVSVSFGLLTLYREKANVRNQGTGLLADTCFGIYVFHPPILVGVSMVLRGALIPLVPKAAVAALATFLLSLGVAWLVRRVPGLGKVFA